MSIALKEEKANWIDKYRPINLDQCILTNIAKKVFGAIIVSGKVPNLLLHGGYGIGKTSVARLIAQAAMQKQGQEWNYLHNSVRFSDPNAAALTNEAIKKIQSTRIWNEVRQIWVLDEMDKLAMEYQARFLGALEDQTHANGFILTANDLDEVHRGLQDRCTCLCLDFPDSDMEQIVPDVQKFGDRILTAEGIKFTDESLMTHVEASWSQPRNFVADLEVFSVTGELLPL